MPCFPSQSLNAPEPVSLKICKGAKQVPTSTVSDDSTYASAASEKVMHAELLETSFQEEFQSKAVNLDPKGQLGCKKRT